MHFFIIPLLVMLVTQAAKNGIELYKGSFTWRGINGYGGMPSSHAALFVSLAYTIGYFRGIETPEFGIAAILLVITLRDALGFRHQIGEHGYVLNKLIKELPDREEYKFPVMQERIGHKTAEVAVGIICGLILTALLIPAFG